MPTDYYPDVVIGQDKYGNSHFRPGYCPLRSCRRTGTCRSTGDRPCLADETMMGVLLERRELANRHAEKHGSMPPWFSPPFPFERDPKDYKRRLIKQFEIKALMFEALVRIHKAMYRLPSRSSSSIGRAGAGHRAKAAAFFQ
jgi:hypothetical protein